MATTKKPAVKKTAKKPAKKPTAKAAPVAPAITSTLRDSIDRLFGEFSYASIMSVTRARQLLADAGLGMIQPHEEWKVTKAFIKSVESGGGWCSLTIGTPIIDGRGILSLVMKLFNVTNPESSRFIGHGSAYYSDLAALQRKLYAGTIKVVVVRVGEPPRSKRIEPTLEAQQALVGGNIEAVRVAEQLFLFCNEDGQLLGLPANFSPIPALTIMGDVFFGRVDAEGELRDVTDADVELLRRFAR